ncbi:hypothetical protein AJ80_07769 [Polytolypa hystricis UAMH7299]|uniref:Uncharacterized protein n=1 Tax=Polytolypa hystricis (strain UAMH7299) TaxID=1447883 RepID=A0A2B7XIQ7_POLH7|nr:hypothetical protein AJ80_07769 [Polytolypa hystricis UAMH7299]
MALKPLGLLRIFVILLRVTSLLLATTGFLMEITRTALNPIHPNPFVYITWFWVTCTDVIDLGRRFLAARNWSVPPVVWIALDFVGLGGLIGTAYSLTTAIWGYGSSWDDFDRFLDENEDVLKFITVVQFTWSGLCFVHFFILVSNCIYFPCLRRSKRKNPSDEEGNEKKKGKGNTEVTPDENAVQSKEETQQSTT